MIYHLSKFLDPDAESLLRLGFRYVSSRAGFAFLTSFLIVVFFSPKMIRFFIHRGWVNHQRTYMLDASSKEGVPVMGGILLFLAATISVFLWCDLLSPMVQISLVASVWFFALGLGDDILKIKGQHSDAGFSRKVKYAVQILFGLGLGLILISAYSPHPDILRMTIHVPTIKEPMNIGMLQVVFSIITIVLISNSVNFADGMDGLATAPSFMTFLGLTIFAYIIGNVIWADHFLFYYFEEVGIVNIASSELVMVSCAVMGALLGFLWYNTYPAQIFMGDCGSMYLGGLMGCLFILIKQELLFPIFGLFFVLEVLSVVIQDWFGIKLLGRRILFRAPLHENFKFIGWSEPKIVVRMWILSAAALAIGLMTIKMR